MSIISIGDTWFWGSTIHLICNGVGVCTVEFLKDTTWGYICDLTVGSTYRREGIGRILMKEAETSILIQGLTEARLAVEKTREWQIKWYKRLGYEVYDEDEHLYYMKRKLS